MKIVLGLDTIKELLARLGNPQDRLNVIHIAGTNGKGSTIAMLSSILKKAGYRVGKYTSPAVFTNLEMYQIDNENIQATDYANLAKKVTDVAASMEAEGLAAPTEFERDTAIAYVYLAEKQCDIAIIETGMGGDLDATNVCSNVLASVITSVSLDHTGFLGDTLEEIASHKAGIIKAGCPVVVSNQSEQVLGVIESRAKELGAPYIMAQSTLENTSLGMKYSHINMSLLGTYQQTNGATAISVVDVLREQGYNIPDEAVIQGLAHTYWPGRFEIISRNPLVIIDGAHNPGAVEELKKTLEEKYFHYKYVFIMGVLADKDYSTEIELIAGMASKIITVTPDNDRALSAEGLAAAVSKVNACVVAAESIDDAVNKGVAAYNQLDGDKLILAFGSLSYMAQLKEAVKKICR